ncbi:MAG: hypothetical protein V4719_12620 [Planctomycetota bacterium]
MTELRRTIDEIRFLLQDDAFVVTDQLTQCAADYAIQCHDVNVRLRKCEEFLHQGLRSEALHLAEMAPNLLDLLGQLDFPERSEWVDLLVGYSLPKPEPLLVDVAATLNEAYAIQEPMQRLLDQHRLYALARSPLTQRLKVLRSLAEIDFTAGHWEPDIRDMERARFREIESEARSAVSQGEVDQLKTLVAELNNGQWLETAPATLLRDVKQKGGNVARNQAREQLELLEEALHGAHSSMDLAQARQMRDAWKANAKTAQLSPQDELAVRAAPVLDWVEDEDRRDAAEKAFRRAVAELEQRLDDHSLTSTELQQFGHAVEKCGRGIPEPLKLRYRNRVASLDFGETRRNRLKIGGIVGAVLAVVGVICVAIYLGNEAEKSRKIMAAAGKLIEDAKLDDAGKLLAEHAARMTTDEGLALKNKLADAVRTEHDRAAEFAAALEKGQQVEDLGVGEKAIKQARDLARNADEKIAVGKLETAWTIRRDAEVAQSELRYRSIVESTTSRLGKLNSMLTAPGVESEARQIMELISSDLGSLRALESKVARELTSQAALLESRYESFHKVYGELQRKNALLQRMAQLSLFSPKAEPSESQVGEYRELLQQFVTAFPNDSLTPGFRGAGNVEAAQAALARRKLATDWNQFWPKDGADVELRIKACTSFLTDYPGSPDRAAVSHYLTFLKSVQWREKGDEDSDQPVKSRLRSLFSGKLIRDGHMLRGKDGKCYYLAEETDYSSRSFAFKFKYLSGFNGELKSTKDIEPLTLETLKTTSPPQKVIADQIYETVSDVELKAWDTYLQKLAMTLVSAKDVDDFLRYFLLLRTVQYASNGNSLLAAELKKSLSDLEDSQMDLSASWMDPNDSSAKSARQLADVLLKRMTDLEGAWKRATTAQEKLNSELFRLAWPVGWVSQTADRKWALQTSWTSERKHALMFVSAADENGIRSWLPLGTAQGGVAELDIPLSGAPPEGAIVFVSPLPISQKPVSAR